MKSLSKFVPYLVVAILGLSGVALLASTSHSYSGWTRGSGPHHGKQCHKRHHGPGSGPGKHWRHGPGHLAMKLSAAETMIGIRADQLDTWRDFTDALLAVMKRPHFPKATDGKEQPFALVEGIANNVIDRGKSAEDLLKATEALRAKLTPEQLEKVSEIEARIRARHGHGRHSRRGFTSPMPDQSAAPDDDDDAPDDSDAAPPASEQ